MNIILKQCKALLWKEYREARSSLLVTVILTYFLVQLVTQTRTYTVIKTVMDWWSWLPSFYTQSIPWIFVIAGIFFLPLISRESERNVLNFLAVKPISSNRFGAIYFLSAYVFALISTLFFLVFFIYGSLPINMPPDIRNIIFSFSTICLVFIVFIYQAFFLLAFSMLFFLLSCATSNRIRSIALAFGGISSILFLCLYLDTTLGNEEGSLWIKIAYLARISPIPTYAYLTVFVGVLAFAILYFRMYRSFLRWPRYAVAGAIPVAAWIGLFATGTVNHNITSVSIVEKSLPPSAWEMIQSYAPRVIPPKAADQPPSYDVGPANIQRRGQHLILVREEMAFDESKALNHSVRLTIRSNDPTHKKSLFEGEQTLFDKSLRDCFQLKEPLDRTNQRHACWWNKLYWSGHLAEHNGIVSAIGTIGDSSLEEKSVMFYGHIRWDKDIKFTPVRRIALHYPTSTGKETKIFDCLQPGIFEIKRNKEMPPDIAEALSPQETKTVTKNNRETQDLNAWADRVTVGYLLESMPMISYGWDAIPQYSGERLFLHPQPFSMDQYLRLLRWPVFSCLDLSDPETLNLYVGSKYLSPVPGYPLSIHYFTPPVFAVDGSRIVQIYYSTLRAYLSVLDVSDPANMKETARIPAPFGWELGNWKLSLNNQQDRLMLIKDKLILKRAEGIYVYTLSEDNQLTPYARLVNLLYPRWNVVDLRVEGNRLFTLWNTSKPPSLYLAQYDMGNASSGNTESHNFTDVLSLFSQK